MFKADLSKNKKQIPQTVKEKIFEDEVTFSE